MEDALELAAATAAAAVASAAPATQEQSSANYSDCEWALKELEDSLNRFKKAEQQFHEKSEELKRKEEEYEKKSRDNAAEATKNFSEQTIKFLPHVTDKDRFLKELPAKLQERVQEIAAELKTTQEDVLVCFFADLSSQGAPTASVREEIDLRASVICGKRGLAIIMASDTPSAKGRPTPKKAPRGAAAAADAADGAPPGALEGLPAVESSNQEYKDQAQVKRLLSKDFANLFSMGGSDESRYCEPVAFRREGKTDFRAMAILPAENSPWLALQLISSHSLSAGSEPAQFVDAGAGAASKARKGEIAIVPARNLSNKTLRHQRGTAMFKNLFDDIDRAVQTHAAATKHKAAALWVNLYCWVGDDVEANACLPCARVLFDCLFVCLFVCACGCRE